MRKILMSGVATLAFLHGGAAFAQGSQDQTSQTGTAEPGAPSENQPAAEGVNEIVVTARRRNEGLLETPVAVTAFSAADLERQQITSVADVQNSTPSLVYEAAAGNSSDARVFIRAVGNANPNVTAEQGVGIYIDGIYYGRSQGALIDNLDLASIEILRGPQGTLFGRNTIGGAVNIISARPDPTEFTGSAELTYARFNRVRARAMVNVPIGDAAAIRASVLYDHDDGYSVNDVDGRRLDNRDTLAFQGSIRVLPAHNVTWDANILYARDRSHGRAYQCVRLGNDPIFGAAYPPACDATNANGIRRTRSNELLTGYVDTLSLSSTLQWDVGPVAFVDDLTVKALVGYQHTDSLRTLDFDATSLDGIMSVDIDRQTEQLSGELQILGRAFENRLNFVIGIYADREGTPGTGERYTGVYPILDNILPQPLNTIQRLHLRNNSRAVYAQATFDVSEILSLTAGLRYTEEDKGFDLVKFFSRDDNRLTPVGPLTADGTFIRSFREWTPMGTVQLNAPSSWLDGALDQGMIYFTYSRGFKGGGFNGNGDSVAGNLTSYAPEQVNNYELGLKAGLFGRQLTGSISVYRMDYRDIQLAVQGQNPSGMPVSSIFNAGAAVIEGIEMELQARIARTLRVSLTADVTDARFTRFQDGALDRSNEPINYVPDYRVTGSIENEFELGNGLTLTPRAQVTQTGERWLVTDRSAVGREVGRVGPTTQVDVSLRLGIGERTSIVAYGKNIFDETYINDVLPVGTVSLTYYNEPATYGLTLRHRF